MWLQTMNTIHFEKVSVHPFIVVDRAFQLSNFAFKYIFKTKFWRFVMAYNNDSDKVKEKKKSKREAIMNAVIMTVAQKGFHKTNISDIARAANVADGTVYLYFKSKDEMFIKAFEELATKKLKTIKQLIDTKQSALERLSSFFDYHIEIITENPYIARFIGVEIRQSPDFYEKYPSYQPFKEYISYLQQLIEEAKAEGDIRDVDAEAVSYIIFGTMDFILAEWAMKNQEFPLEDMKNKISDILQFGLMKRGEK